MLSTQKTYNKNKKIIKKQFKLCITKNNRKRYEVDRHMIENVFERRRKMNEHEYSNAIVHAFQKFKAPFSGKIVHIFPEQSAVI